MKKRMKYLLFIIIIAVVVGLVIGFTILKEKNPNARVESRTNVNSNVSLVGNAIYETIITPENLPGFLQKQDIIKDIPNGGTILLKLYHYNLGRQIDNTYVLTKGKVEKGVSDNPDVIVYLDSKYVSYLGDFCNAMKTAKQNRELGYETSMSELSFMWKYKGMMKYKSCFGL